uniref:Uncharacterized protein n=1 Tax=Gopherus agassizii TaxID=38772 RepID=A0A452IU65_9SAUR
IIQSSQPSSLKLTCRVFLLHRVFAFLPCPLPPVRVATVVLRLLLSLEGVSWPGSGGSKNGGFSFLLLCEKATRRALSTKHSRWPEPSFSLQSLMASHTSNTSQRGEPESRMSAARESHSRGGRSAPGQAESRAREGERFRITEAEGVSSSKGLPGKWGWQTTPRCCNVHPGWARGGWSRLLSKRRL